MADGRQNGKQKQAAVFRPKKQGGLSRLIR
jgi:hypothetical protein